MGETHHDKKDKFMDQTETLNRKAFASWSGGKDSCLALYTAQQAGYSATLFNMLTADGAHSRSHGLRLAMLERQAQAMGLPIAFGRAEWDDYEKMFVDQLMHFSSQGIGTGVFGDIDLEDHRKWVEQVCEKAGLAAMLPLWQKPRQDLLNAFFDAGFKARIVCIKEAAMGREWLGRDLDAEAVREFEQIGIDICGEEGEYHTFVYDGPIFKTPVRFSPGEIQSQAGYAFVELKP